MAHEDRWLALLEAEDVDGFNAQRTERTRIELFAADLSQRKLAGVDLSNGILEKSDLTGSDLSHATLVKANLAGADASGAIFRDAIGARAKFKEAWLDGADLTGADFLQADFAEANLENTRGENVRFSQARLRGVKATGASWRGANLSEARIEQAVFRGADLRNADLSEVYGGGVDLTDAQLDGANLVGARLAGAKLAGARLTAARLAGANLAGADLSRCDLAAADLSRANLSNAILHGAVLRGAVLVDANLEGVRLEGVDLAEADLSGLDPQALGLDAGVTSSLSGFGVTVDEQASFFLSDVSVARQGARVAIVWENPEGEPAPAPEGEEPEEPSVVRFAVMGGGRTVVGVVPVPGESVLDRQVIAFRDRFRVVVTRARPEGAALVLSDLSVDGVLGSGRTLPLGYDPSVSPVIREENGRLLMYGLARRGPTLVIHDLSDGEPKLVRSQPTPTAQGFVHGQPVLACKGGVVMAVDATGAQAPRRCPDGFPHAVSSAIQLASGDIVALWSVPRRGRAAGGVRMAVIGKRHAPKEESLGDPGNILALCATPRDGESAFAFWVEGLDATSPTTLWTCVVPTEEPVRIAGPTAAGGQVAEVRIAPGVVGLLDREGGFTAIDPAEGVVIARWDATSATGDGVHG